MDKHKEENTEHKKPFEEQKAEDNLSDLQDEKKDQAEKAENADNVTDDKKEEKEALEKKIQEQNDTYLRLMAEFDNYRKHTLREKADLIKNGGEKVITNLLPVVDDFERALDTIGKAESMEAVKEGIDLIYQKFMSYLKQQGVEAIEAVGKPFDTDEFDAAAMIPTPQPEMKGKVIDCIQTGYKLNDKVIRHAKVVVGE